jgi:hypothetical protein
VFAFDVGEHFGDIIDVVQQRLDAEDRLGPEWLELDWRAAHVAEPASQRFIHQVLEACFAILPQPLQLDRYVVINGKRGPHASNHKEFDVSM